MIYRIGKDVQTLYHFLEGTWTFIDFSIKEELELIPYRYGGMTAITHEILFREDFDSWSLGLQNPPL
jgi:hypothetical protein